MRNVREALSRGVVCGWAPHSTGPEQVVTAVLNMSTHLSSGVSFVSELLSSLAAADLRALRSHWCVSARSVVVM